MAETGKAELVVSHLEESEFEGGGLRPFFVYRDLGMAEATGGRYHAHVIRAAQAPTDGTGRHRHRLDFQMVYVLKGWVKFWYEGKGEVLMKAGVAVHQPPGILHELMACSDDCEMLEITSPAEFATGRRRRLTGGVFDGIGGLRARQHAAQDTVLGDEVMVQRRQKVQGNDDCQQPCQGAVGLMRKSGECLALRHRRGEGDKPKRSTGCPPAPDITIPEIGMASIRT